MVVAPYLNSYPSEVHATKCQTSIPSSLLYSPVTIFQRKIASLNIKAFFLVERSEGRTFYQLPKPRLPRDHKVSLKQANRKSTRHSSTSSNGNLHAYVNFKLLCCKSLRFALPGGFRRKAESTLKGFNVLETDIVESWCFSGRIKTCLCTVS